MDTYTPDLKLLGEWAITRKLDGVQAVYDFARRVTSRSGKPLYNLPVMAMGRYEVFLGTVEDSVSAVKTHDGTPVPPECLYKLAPEIDPRLILEVVTNPSRELIEEWFHKVLANGDEGLVLVHTKTGKSYKLKPYKSWDVPVTGVIPGKGQFKDAMGALMTPMGKVGTGFKRHERYETWTIGETIEVEAMALTSAGKFRHPRFKRRRFDK